MVTLKTPSVIFLDYLQAVDILQQLFMCPARRTMLRCRTGCFPTLPETFSLAWRFKSRCPDAFWGVPTLQRSVPAEYVQITRCW